MPIKKKKIQSPDANVSSQKVSIILKLDDVPGTDFKNSLYAFWPTRKEMVS